MNEIKEKKKEQLLESLNELEQLIKTKLSTNTAKTSDELEEKFKLMSEKNKKVYDILEKVIAELENLLTTEENKCQQ